jgi:hypothetical protein
MIEPDRIRCLPILRIDVDATQAVEGIGHNCRVAVSSLLSFSVGTKDISQYLHFTFMLGDHSLSSNLRETLSRSLGPLAVNLFNEVVDVPQGDGVFETWPNAFIFGNLLVKRTPETDSAIVSSCKAIYSKLTNLKIDDEYTRYLCSFQTHSVKFPPVFSGANRITQELWNRYLRQVPYDIFPGLNGFFFIYDIVETETMFFVKYYAMADEGYGYWNGMHRAIPK